MTATQNITAIVRDRRGKILSIGKNSYIKTHTLQAKIAKRVGLEEKVYQHAEIAALVKLRDHHKPHSIEILRINKQGKYMMAAPCSICAEAIKLFNISNVRYTTNANDT